MVGQNEDSRLVPTLCSLDGDVICFTDDDCTVPPGLAKALTDMLRSDPDADMVFCAVTGTVNEGCSDGTPSTKSRVGSGTARGTSAPASIVPGSPTTIVAHHGFRSGGRDADELTKRDFLSLGAMFAKLAFMSGWDGQAVVDIGGLWRGLRRGVAWRGVDRTTLDLP